MPDSMGTVPPSSTGGSTAGGSKGLIIAVVVVVILAAALYLIFSSGGEQKTKRAEPPTPTGETSEALQPSPVPNEVYSYVGEVTNVGNGQITVLAKKDLNLLGADATLTVKADANTQVIRRTIPRVLPEDGGTNLFKQENIAVSDIEVGDQVTVVSATNVRGVTEFTASRIEVINVQ